MKSGTKDLLVIGAIGLGAIYFMPKVLASLQKVPGDIATGAAQGTIEGFGNLGAGFTNGLWDAYNGLVGGLFNASPFGAATNMVAAGAGALANVPGMFATTGANSVPQAANINLSNFNLRAANPVGVVAAGLGVPSSAVNPFVATVNNTPTVGPNYGTYLNKQGQGMSGYIPAGSTNYLTIKSGMRLAPGKTAADYTTPNARPTATLTAAKNPYFR